MKYLSVVPLEKLEKGKIYLLECVELYMKNIYIYLFAKILENKKHSIDKKIIYKTLFLENYNIFSDILDFPDEKIEYEIVSPPHRVFHKRHITIVYSYPERMLRIRKRFFLLDEKFLKKFLKNKNWIINEHENISLSKPIFKIILESDKNNSEC
ncbi:MAG: hypothetical protein BWY04_01078 [candidate division CPR1 bacterium ADurb.Bin160]|uniref:Uncharacterized protein n=1 Tax=candidate division CPR1 bacterium ADurb.Bin160 TaxID=1852826 RepID=A0A1V5ZLW6_9BACT|nr:MAG: hypothetical protein BWY04_01078 [candidate division CPR1 bacterium ADurb.Bin160]